MKLYCKVHQSYTHWHVTLKWDTGDTRGDRPVYRSLCFITGITKESTAHRIARALQAEFGELPS